MKNSPEDPPTENESWSSHDLFLFMLSLSQIEERREGERLFVEAFTARIPSLQLLHPEAQPPDTRVAIEVRSLRQYYGTLSVAPDEYRRLPPDEQEHLHNAAQMLAILLENRLQEEVLKSNNLELSREIAEERHFRDELVRTLPLHVFILELRELRFSYLNNAARKAIAAPHIPLSELEPQQLLPFINREDKKDLLDFLRRMRWAPLEETREFTFRIHAQNGSFHWLQCCLTPFTKDSGGETVTVMGCGMEITRSKEWEAELRRNVGEKDELLREVHHRVKNNMQIITSLLNLQRQETADGEIHATLHRLQNRINSMAAVHEQLYSQGNAERVRMRPYVQQLTDYLLYSYERSIAHPQFELKIPPRLGLPLTQALPIGLILNELITNSLRHAFPELGQGHIYIRMTASRDGAVELYYRDNGRGFTPEDHRSGGLGIQLLYILAEQIEGKVSWNTQEGTTLQLNFPVSS